MNKTCTGPCGRTLLATTGAFSVARWSRVTGLPILQPYCRQCGSKRRYARHRANPERGIAAMHRYQERVRADPERLAELNARRRERMTGSPEYKHARPTENKWVAALPVRLAVERSRMPMAEVARLAGLDDSNLHRALRQERMEARKAALILEAVSVLPADLGF